MLSKGSYQTSAILRVKSDYADVVSKYCLLQYVSCNIPVGLSEGQ